MCFTPCASMFHLFFFFNDTATTEIYTLSLHDALPIYLRLDPRVLSFALGVTLLSVVLFGVAPTLRAARTDLHGVLREASRGSSGGPGRHRLLRLSVMVQVAVSLMLLLGAGLMIR